jgi:hypothetical protein
METHQAGAATAVAKHVVNIVVEVDGKNKHIQFDSSPVSGRAIRERAGAPSSDDLTRLVHGKPSGGNIYNRRICDGLTAIGWQVIQHVAPGCWPWPDRASVQALGRLLAGIGDGAVVLVDGLIASMMPGILVPEAGRLRLAVLVHVSLGEAPPSHAVADAQTREAAVLCAAQYVITTSWSTRERLLRRYPLPPDKVHVAQPGVDPAQLASGTDRGGELLCVAPVSSHKGHDVLLAALAATADLPWRCVCVGSLDRDPVFVERLRLEAEAAGVGAGSVFLACRSATTCPSRTLRPTCSCWPRGLRRTEWWSPRLWLVGCRSSRRRSAGCRRPWARRAMAADPASWCRPKTASHWRPRSATGWSTPISGIAYEKLHASVGRRCPAGMRPPIGSRGSSPRPRRHDATVPDQGTAKVRYRLIPGVW